MKAELYGIVSGIKRVRGEENGNEAMTVNADDFSLHEVTL